MSAVGKLLASISLGQYAEAFEANDIDMDLLTQVDDQTLKDIGLSSAGHRLRIRNAIAKLITTSAVEANISSAVPAPEKLRFCRTRQLTVMFCDLVGSTALSGKLDRVTPLRANGSAARREREPRGAQVASGNQGSLGLHLVAVASLGRNRQPISGGLPTSLHGSSAAAQGAAVQSPPTLSTACCGLSWSSCELLLVVKKSPDAERRHRPHQKWPRDDSGTPWARFW